MNGKCQIYIICGKAKAGKDTAASFLQKNIKNSVILSITDPLKEYAKKVTGWNGDEKNKPRDFLQTLGVDVIQSKIDPNFLIRRVIEDIQVMSFYKNVIIISGVRLKREIEMIKKAFSNVVCMKIVRPNQDNGLTNKQKNHITEKDLDNYLVDYTIINDGDLENLKKQVFQILKEV